MFFNYWMCCVFSTRCQREEKGNDEVYGIEIKKPDKTAELLLTR